MRKKTKGVNGGKCPNASAFEKVEAHSMPSVHDSVNQAACRHGYGVCPVSHSATRFKHASMR